MLYEKTTNKRLGNLGKFSFEESLKKYGEPLVLYDDNDDEKLLYSINKNYANLLDIQIKKGGHDTLYDYLEHIMETINKPTENSKVLPDVAKKIEDRRRKLEQLKDQNETAYKFFKKYITERYDIKDRLLYNIPVEVDDYCKTQPSKINTPLYRGLAFTKEWFNNEVEKYDNKNDIMYLKTNHITSWSTDLEISQQFLGDDKYLLIELVSDPVIFCDLRYLNNLEKEVLLYPGRYKVKIIEKSFNVY